MEVRNDGGCRPSIVLFQKLLLVPGLYYNSGGIPDPVCQELPFQMLQWPLSIPLELFVDQVPIAGHVPDKARAMNSGVASGHSCVGTANTLIDHVRRDTAQRTPEAQSILNHGTGEFWAPFQPVQGVTFRRMMRVYSPGHI